MTHGSSRWPGVPPKDFPALYDSPPVHHLGEMTDAPPKFAIGTCAWSFEDWRLPRVTRFLEENGVCVVWNDTSSLAHQREAPFDFLPQTTDFLYLRLMGDLHTKYRADGIPRHRYHRLLWQRDEALDGWAVKLRKHFGGTSRLLLFANNHYEGFAPLTCQRLAQRFDIALPLPSPKAPPSPEPSTQLDLL